MIIDSENYKTIHTGSKARNLFLLAEAGYPVPPFFCVDKAFSEEEVLACLEKHFPDTALFSVRSSASSEDTAEHSLAGQFQTFLRVPRSDLCARIRDVLSDSEDPGKISLCQIHGIDPKDLAIHVIVQEMIESDLSGVLFTANPQGPLNESVLVCGAGTGDRVVEDKTDTTTYYYNLSDHVYYYEQAGSSPLLPDARIEELILLSQQIKERFDAECDIEFAIMDDILLFLQVRPITTIDKEAPVIILDNSNIVESYPGITLPLTQSFIREAYYRVFKNLLIRLTGEPGTVQEIDDSLRYMVDMANGRVYYRISNWYDVLLFLPFSSRLIPIWQEMMGVKNKTVSSGLQGKIRQSTRLKTAFSFFRLLLTCPREMTKLDRYFEKIIERFDALDIRTDDNRALLACYHDLQDRIVKRWDMTLVNDMYGFLFTGLLKARLRARRIPEPELAANRAISGIRELESMRPIREMQKLAKQAREENLLPELEKIRTNEDYARYIKKENAFSKNLQDYIRRFGDRNVEELKLESKTFRTDPALLIRCIVQNAENSPEPSAPYGAASEKSPLRLTGLSAFFAKRAAAGIRNREKSRLNRGRLYGMMRSLVLQMGQNLYAQNRISCPEDIFWLFCDEIEAASLDPSMDLAGILSERKRLYEGFYRLPAYSRLVFSGKVTDKHPKNSRSMRYEGKGGVYTGTACSPGIAEGEVLIVDTPSLRLDTRDKVLVAKMTDPGWVFLIANAKAVLSEKGSLLSHTAIISRELGKPSVVGIEHITEYLKTGDKVRVDGNTGMVTVLG